MHLFVFVVSLCYNVGTSGKASLTNTLQEGNAMRNKHQIICLTVLFFFILVLLGNALFQIGLADEYEVILERDIIYGREGDLSLWLDGQDQA